MNQAESFKPSSLLPYREALRLGPSQVGAKAYSVALIQKETDLLVPEGVVLRKNVWQALQSQEDESSLCEAVRQRLDRDLYIVRSSAIGEDSATCSWAGCFDSFAEIPLGSLADAVIKCGNSLYERRAVAYAGLHHTKPVTEMAILIQEYILAEFNGVGFSANPVTGNRREVVIEYQRGKSGGVVGGEGFSSSVLFSADAMAPQEGHPDWLFVVARSVRQLEQIFQRPVDVEWIWREGQLVITQTRPITTL